MSSNNSEIPETIIGLKVNKNRDQTFPSPYKRGKYKNKRLNLRQSDELLRLFMKAVTTPQWRHFSYDFKCLVAFRYFHFTQAFWWLYHKYDNLRFKWENKYIKAMNDKESAIAEFENEAPRYFLQALLNVEFKKMKMKECYEYQFLLDLNPYYKNCCRDLKNKNAGKQTSLDQFDEEDEYSGKKKTLDKVLFENGKYTTIETDEFLLQCELELKKPNPKITERMFEIYKFYNQSSSTKRRTATNQETADFINSHTKFTVSKYIVSKDYSKMLKFRDEFYNLTRAKTEDDLYEELSDPKGWKWILYEYLQDNRDASLQELAKVMDCSVSTASKRRTYINENFWY